MACPFFSLVTFNRPVMTGLVRHSVGALTGQSPNKTAMKKKWLILCALVLSTAALAVCGFLWSRQVTVTGHVRDQLTERSVQNPDVTIRTLYYSKKCETHLDGTFLCRAFSIPGLPGQDWTVYVSNRGRTFLRFVDVKPGEEVKVLTPDILVF